MGALKNNLAIAISAIAVIISLAALYTTSLKPAKITLGLGENMELYHTGHSDPLLNIDLPIVLHNAGAQPGVILSLGVILEDQETKEAIFLKWLGFLKPTEAGFWSWESNATPVSVPGHSDVTKMVRFYGNGSEAGWIPKPINYYLYLLAWTSEGQKPSIKIKSSWTFNEKDISEIKRKFEEKEKKTASTWITRSTFFSPTSKKLSPAELDMLIK